MIRDKNIRIMCFGVVLYNAFLWATPIPLCPIKLIIAPATITQPGEYKLATDIIGTVTIDADNVTLSLDGKSISGAHVGIFVDTHNGIIIKNGIIENCAQIALDAQSCEHITVQDIDFADSARGANFASCNDIVIERCSFNDIFETSGAPGALRISNSENGIIDKCLFQRNDFGLFFSNSFRFMGSNLIIRECIDGSDGLIIQSGSSDVTIRDCLIENNAMRGVAINGAAGNTVENCIISGNGQRGFLITGVTSFYNIIRNNICNNNAESGMVLSGGNLLVDNNIINNNGSVGLDVLGDNNIIQNNRINNNASMGIQLRTGSDSNTVSNNIVNNNNSISGIRIVGSFNILQNNIASHNTGDGYRIDAANNYFVNNRAYHNSENGFDHNSPDNSFFQNQAQGNAGVNYNNVPNVIVSLYSFAAGDFISTSSIATFNNLSIDS